MDYHNPREPSLTVHSLGDLTDFSAGGTARLYRTTAYPGMLYKKYRDPTQHDARVITQLRFRSELRKGSSDKDTYLSRHFSWPDAAIRDETGEIVGVLIPEAPPEYWARLATGHTRLRDLSFLIYERRAQMVGLMPVADAIKFEIIARIVDACRFLESFGMVYEDLSPLNIVWTTGDQACVQLHDCDSVRMPLEPKSPPLALTYDWVDPRLLGGDAVRPDLASVSYTIGLIVARVFVDPNWKPPVDRPDSSAASRLGEVFPDRNIRHVVLASLMSSSDRPTLSEWSIVLQRAAESVAGTSERTPTVDVASIAIQPPAFTALSYRDKDYIALTIGALFGCISALLLLFLVSGA